MDHAFQAEKQFTASALGALIVVALVVVVRNAIPDFPSTSPASMAFFGALASAAVANIIAVLARIFIKAPDRVPMKGWMVVLAISRISFAWALLLLVGTAVIGAIIDRQLARTLFQTVIVEMIFGAFWFMATSMVAILAVLWFGRRKANPNKNLSA